VKIRKISIFDDRLRNEVYGERGRMAIEGMETGQNCAVKDERR
jgi:hypothetical protein